VTFQPCCPGLRAVDAGTDALISEALEVIHFLFLPAVAKVWHIAPDTQRHVHKDGPGRRILKVHLVDTGLYCGYLVSENAPTLRRAGAFFFG